MEEDEGEQLEKQKNMCNITIRPNPSRPVIQCNLFRKWLSTATTASATAANSFGCSGRSFGVKRNKNIIFAKELFLGHVLPVVLAVAVYWNSLDGDFVHDDIPAIVTNPDVVGTRSWVQAFKNDFWGSPMASSESHKSYRPLTILLFR